jgi:hypothetical protein
LYGAAVVMSTSRGAAPGMVATVAALVFLARALATLVVLPPWQTPDEAQHAVLMEILIRGDEEERRTRYSRRLEGEIVQSMDRWNWWEHVGLRRPQPLPAHFDVTPRLSAVTNRGVAGEVPAFHWLAGRMARAARDLEQRLYIARALSVACVTVAVYGMARLVLGALAAQPAAAAAALAIVVFHPQLALVAAGGTPDGLAILLATAGLWIAIDTLRQGRPRLGAFVFLAVLMIAGMLTKRTTLVLVYCFVVCAAWPLLGREHRRPALAIAAAGLTSLIVLILVARAVLPTEWSYAYGKFVRPLNRLRNLWLSDGWREPAFLRQWFDSLFVSAWHVHGWVQYMMPTAWYTGFWILTAAMGAGALRTVTGIPASVGGRAMPVFALGAVTFQMLGVFGFYGLIGINAQGRYLMPILPMAALLVGYAVDALPRRASAVAAAGVCAFMLLASWASFAAILRSYY